MKQIKIRLLLGLAAVLLGVSLPGPLEVQAGMELGKVTSYKLESFADYFEPYIQYDEPSFPDDIRKAKIMSEAQDMHRWLTESEKTWNEDELSFDMAVAAAKLQYSFYRLGFETSGERAAALSELALKKNPDSFKTHLLRARIFGTLDTSHNALQGARAAEEALGLDEEEAKQHHAHYLAALAFYRAGYFRKAYEHLKQQMDFDPDNQSTNDLVFVFDSRVEGWGFIPERISFRTSEEGHRIPVPAKGDYN